MQKTPLLITHHHPGGCCCEAERREQVPQLGSHQTSLPRNCPQECLWRPHNNNIQLIRVKTWHRNKQSIKNPKRRLGGCFGCHHHCKAIQISEQTQGPPHQGDGFCLLRVFTTPSGQHRNPPRALLLHSRVSENETRLFPWKYQPELGRGETKTGESPGKSQQKARVQSHQQAEDVVRGISLPSHSCKWRARMEALEEALGTRATPEDFRR